MGKKLIDIDDELLDAAREILGTTTQRDTVTRALEDVVRRRQRQGFLDLLASGALDDLGDEEIMKGAWR